MAIEKVGTWRPSWVPRLWKSWLSLVGSVGTVLLALFGIFERSTLSAAAWQALSQEHTRPLWSIALPVFLTLFGVSALFIWLMQLWDRRRVAEAEAQLASLVEHKAEAEKELRKKALELENLQDVFRERERMRMLDHITGIPNFQSWEADLKEWASRGNNEKKFSLILIDMDNLKWLNERSRECADKVLRYFARSTYASMRRDEQIYKALETPDQAKEDKIPFRPAEMYRHYQGGDEFFFIIGGSVYDAVGFVNRLAERVRSYRAAVRETILQHYLEVADADAFRLSFSGVVLPILPGTEPSTALTNAYSILHRAKGGLKSRLLVVFDDSYEEPAAQRVALERRIESIRSRLGEWASKVESGEAEARPRLDELREAERRLVNEINIVTKAEQLFSVVERDRG